MMVNPVMVGEGTTIFKGIKGKVKLKLIKTKVFKSGNVLLFYEPQYK